MRSTTRNYCQHMVGWDVCVWVVAILFIDIACSRMSSAHISCNTTTMPMCYVYLCQTYICAGPPWVRMSAGFFCLLNYSIVFKVRSTTNPGCIFKLASTRRNCFDPHTMARFFIVGHERANVQLLRANQKLVSSSGCSSTSLASVSDSVLDCTRFIFCKEHFMF